jgi:hypothetical protein
MHWESLLRSERHSTAATISLQAANTVDLKLFSEEAEELVDPHLPGPVYCEIRQIVSNRRTLNAIKEAVQVALCQASSVISTYDLVGCFGLFSVRLINRVVCLNHHAYELLLVHRIASQVCCACGRSTLELVGCQRCLAWRDSFVA